ncbi:MAG: hypothetical protein D6679_03505 [Candidatus Hydrogenedentota bacterium]|nr:MAG: hypothetical protein D6679_03505 [Candidatus Hydrogenedentota bacterium]
MLFLGLALVFLGGHSPASSLPGDTGVAGRGTSEEKTAAERARMLAANGHVDEALQLLEEVKRGAAVGRRDEARFLTGWILFRYKRAYEKAIEEFERLLVEAPDSPYGDDALYYAGFINQYYLKDPAAALQYYRRGYAAFPNGDFRFALADKIRALGGEVPPSESRKGRAVGSERRGGGNQRSDETGRKSSKEDRRFPEETEIAETAPLRPSGTSKITMQFEKAPLKSFIEWIARVTGKNFIIDDNVKGEITIYSGRPIPLSEVYRVFLSILEVKGYAAIESNGMTKIVSRRAAVASEIPIVIDDEAEYPTDRMITRVFQFHTISAGSVQKLIRPFLSGTDQVVINPESNSLIVTGTGKNLRRLAKLIRLIADSRQPLVLRSYRIEYARAAAIATKMTTLIPELTSAPGATPLPMKFLADERTNTLHVLAAPFVQEKVRDLLKELDRNRTAERIVRVFRLEYALAEEVAKQLKLLLGLENPAQAADQASADQTVLMADPRLNSVSVATYAPRVIEMVDSYIQTVDRPPNQRTRRTRILSLKNAQAKELAELLLKIFPAEMTPADAFALGLADKVRISPDQRTNSLIITATDSDWKRVKKLIQDLDVRKAQVLVDAVILETSLNEARALGVNITSLEEPASGKTTVVGGSLLVPPGELAEGGLSVSAVRSTAIGPALHALLSSARTNVLQMPQILALDNEKASISVGNLTPIVSSRTVSGDNVQISGSTGIFQNVEYRNIGLNLDLTPHIGDKGDILLELKLEVQNTTQQSEVGLPVFTNRAIESKIQIANGDYIVLGGLLRTQDDVTKRETPWLAKLPLLGLFFRNTRTSEGKTVLLIFLRPRIVTNTSAAKDVTNEEREKYEVESRMRLRAQDSEVEKWVPQD